MKVKEWDINESKLLNSYELRNLYRSSELEKRRGLIQKRKTPVRDWFLVQLGLHTGLRVQEMSDLKINDLKLLGGSCCLVVRNGKCGKKRIVLFSISFREIVLYYLRWKKFNREPIEPESYLFYSKRTGKLAKRSLQKAFERAAQKAGIHGHSIHHLRHTYGSHLYWISNHNLKLVQKQLGHSSITTTQAYAHLFPPDVINALENLYGSLTTPK